MTKEPEYYIKSHTHTWEESAPDDPPEQWGWNGGYGGNTDMERIYTTLSHPGLDVDHITYAEYGLDDIQPGEIAHILHVDYTTGSTFATGSTFGYSHTFTVAGIFKDIKDAQAAKEKAEAPQDKDYRHYRPWDGYFEHVEKIEITSLVVQI